MVVTETEFAQAEARTAAKRRGGFVVAARYDPQVSRIAVTLDNGIELAFPVRLVEGLADASPDRLSEIEISPSGLGLSWPRLDADVSIPALLNGVFGSKHWMAARLGALGGQARTRVKAKASRENGRKGGRPASGMGL
jgi:hypothetical protein